MQANSTCDEKTFNEIDLWSPEWPFKDFIGKRVRLVSIYDTFRAIIIDS